MRNHIVLITGCCTAEKTTLLFKISDTIEYLTNRNIHRVHSGNITFYSYTYEDEDISFEDEDISGLIFIVKENTQEEMRQLHKLSNTYPTKPLLIYLNTHKITLQQFKQQIHLRTNYFISSCIMSIGYGVDTGLDWIKNSI